MIIKHYNTHRIPWNYPSSNTVPCFLRNNMARVSLFTGPQTRFDKALYVVHSYTAVETSSKRKKESVACYSVTPLAMRCLFLPDDQAQRSPQ
jgi:hypothetical protein